MNLPSHLKKHLPKRPIKDVRVFVGEDDFSAYNLAVKSAKESNYGVGSMSSPFPTGLIFGFEVAKWKNLSTMEISELGVSGITG